MSTNPAAENGSAELGKLVSRLEHPVTIEYAGEQISLSSRGHTETLDRRSLGALPTGVTFVPVRA